jgi:FkbM family methyltransferase
MSEVEYNGLKFNYRLNTTDWNIIKEACGGLNTRWFDVKSGELWFDIGAHIGAFTCYAASKGAIVSAFEPIPSSFALLQQNVILNNLETHVKTHNVAITDKLGEIELFVDENNYGNCSKYNRGLSKTLKVKTIPASSLNIFDDFCIKLDTEGCEYDILSGIDLTKVNKLVMENHYWLQPREQTLEIVDWLHIYFNHTEEHGGYMHYAWN